MAIVTLRLVDVKAGSEGRPAICKYCGSGVLQRWGGTVRNIKDTHVRQAQEYRYRCGECGRTFRDYPPGISAAQQSRRLVQLAGLCWVLGLSLRGASAILSAFPVALSHTSVWWDVQALASQLRARLPRQVRVLGVDGCYPKVKGQERPTVIAVDLGTGQPVALGAVTEKDWRAVKQWLEPLVQAWGWKCWSPMT
jgi:DNA-directed RNA polymerase subunit RPC12/RpoP